MPNYIPDVTAAKMRKAIGAVGREEFEEVKNNSTSVSYNVQYLTEDQQMQARKNQGLYYSSEEYDWYTIGFMPDPNIWQIYDHEGHTVTVEDFLRGNTGSVMVNFNGNEYYLNTQSDRYDVYMAGCDVLRWIGNRDLIDAYTGELDNVKETMYPDIPFVIYSYHAELVGSDASGVVTEDGFSIAYTSSLHSVPVPIPDEYIPDTIQRVGADVIVPSATEGSTKKFKLPITDDGTISATEVTE